MLNYQQLKPFLFKLSPEQAHHASLTALENAARAPLGLSTINRLYGFSDERLQTTFCGLNFANPLGIAAGYDKNAAAVPGLAALGVGHVEIGTLTRIPQEGNPKPRMFRLPEDGGVINRLGFPNQGVEDALPRLRRLHNRPFNTILGVNIGKGKDTPLEDALDDYAALLALVYPYSDYVTVNISSPNTVGLRKLQGKEFLSGLLGGVKGLRDELRESLPIFVKIAPDLTHEEIDDILEVVTTVGIDAIIATNTTIARDGLRNQHKDEGGGLSGMPLTDKSTNVIRRIYQQTNGSLPIIGVGGIYSVQTAIDKLQAGASLLQVYTGLVYEGPELIKQINQGIVAYMEKVGAGSVGELVGNEV